MKSIQSLLHSKGLPSWGRTLPTPTLELWEKGTPLTPACHTKWGKNSPQESGLQGHRLRMLPVGEGVGGRGKKDKSLYHWRNTREGHRPRNRPTRRLRINQKITIAPTPHQLPITKYQQTSSKMTVGGS